MNTMPEKNPKTWLTYGLIGFLIGVFLIMLGAVGLFAVQVLNPPPTPTLIPTPTQALQDILSQARLAFNVEGEPQQAIDILKPHLDEFSEVDDLSQALDILARAELALGHSQFAAAYLERLVKISPTPTNYALLARAYDQAGDLEHAVVYYLLYMETDDPALTEDLRDLIKERVNQIQSTLSSSTPTPAP